MVSKLSIILLCALSIASAQNGYSRDNPSNQLNYDSFNQGYSEDGDELHGDEIPGEAGRDYPIYSEVPETGFDCHNQQFPGYYADPETQCQAFYICQKGGQSDGFLCPNGTIFNQQYLVCDWWYNFDCSHAEELYSVNEQIVQAMQEADARLSQQQDGYNYNTPGGHQNKDGHSGRYSGPQPGGIQDPSAVYGVPSRNGNGGHHENGHGNGNGKGRNHVNGNGNHGNGRLRNNNHRNGGRSQNNISPEYGVPNQFEGQSSDSQRQVGFNGFQKNGNSNIPRGYDNQNIQNVDQAYGAPSFNGNHNDNGHGGNGNNFNGNGHRHNGNANNYNGNGHNSNGGNRHSGNRNGNGFNGGGSPKAEYGPPSNGFSGPGAQYNSNGGFSNGFNGNSASAPDKSYLPPSAGGFNANGNNHAAFRNGLGNAPTISNRSHQNSKGNSQFSHGSNGPSSKYGAPRNGQFNLNEPNAYNGQSPSGQYGAPSAPDRSYLPQ